MIEKMRPSMARPVQVRATRVPRAADLRGAGAFAYFVAAPASVGDRRLTPRRRSRLRAGKILDVANGFLVECRIYDRSSAGARLRVGGGVVLPRAIRLYDDERDMLFDADVVWRRGADVGIRFAGSARGPDLSAPHLSVLRGKFYAMPA